MKKQLLILTTILISFIGHAQSLGDTFIENFIAYEVTSIAPNITVKTIGYDSNGGTDVNIPATVSNNGTVFNVIEIGGSSFVGEGLTSVIIPDSVITIGLYAFFINSLTSVTIPSGITVIEQGVFENNSLTSVIIPNGVTAIGISAFKSNSLTNIVIPSNVASIGLQAFTNNPLVNVTSVNSMPPTITTGGPDDSFSSNRSGIDLIIPIGTTGVYVTDSGALWTGFNSVTETNGLQVGDTFVNNFITYEITSLSPNEVEAHDYDHTNGPIDVNIPASVMNGGVLFSVTAIGFAAFEYDFTGNQLTSAVLPNTITQINPLAFAFNTISNNVIIPDGITDIGYEAFSGNLITSVIIPDSVITIGVEAFVDNTISSLILGSSIEVIGEDAFAFNQIASVAFPSSLTTVEARAFNGNQLTSVTIPSTITTLENSVFRNNLLTSVTIENGITIMPSDTFLNNQLQSVTIPDSVTIIEQGAFENNLLTSISLNNNIIDIGNDAFNNNQLTTITIPNSVTTIGVRAFQNNPLTSVTSENVTPPSITTSGNFDTFALNRSSIDLMIPVGTTGAYATNSGALWTGFNSVTEDASLSAEEFELVSDIKVISTSDELNIISNGAARLENYTIYSISGAKIATGKENEIPTSSFSSGIYILKLDFDEGTLVKKVAVY